MCEAVKCPAVGHPVLTSAGWVADLLTVCVMSPITRGGRQKPHTAGLSEDSI